MTPDFLTSTFIRFRASLRSVAASITGNCNADDVLHDAFCRLWKNHTMIKSEIEARKLSYVAVRNSAIDSYRRSCRETIGTIDENSLQMTDTDITAEEERRLIYDTVLQISRQALNPRQYEIFRMHDIENIEYGEIARRLSMTPENVRMTLSRARKTIRDIYRQQQT